MTILSTTTYQNLEINIIDGVINIPGTLSTVLASPSANLTGLQGIATSLMVPAANGTNITLLDALSVGNGVHGYTLFAPDNTAIAGAATLLSGLQSNETALLTVLRNHVRFSFPLQRPVLTDPRRSSTARRRTRLSSWART